MAWRFLWAVPTAIPESVYWVQVSTSGGKLEKMRVTHRSHPDAQEAITDYQVLGPSALGESIAIPVRNFE
jgi:hypothetical protein